MKKLRQAFGSIKNLSSEGYGERKNSNERSSNIRKSISASVSNELDRTSYRQDGQSVHGLSVVNYINPLGTNDVLFSKLHKWSFIGDVSKVKKFIKKIDVNVQDSDGRTPLHLCSSAGNIEALLILLSAKANSEIKDKDSRTPLFRAIEKGHLGIVQMLLQYRVDVNVLDNNENTPLHIAVESGSINITEIFLDKGLNPEAPNIFGHTAVHIAALNLEIDIMKLLVSKEVNVNVDDKDGVIPIMIAAKKGCKPLIEILLDAGADATQQDCSGWTAPSYAKYAGFDDIHKFLVNFIQEELEHSPADSTMRMGGNAEHSSAATSNESFVNDIPLDGPDLSWNDDSDDLSLRPRLDLKRFPAIDDEESESKNVHDGLVTRKSLSASATSLGPPKPPRSFASTSSLIDTLDCMTLKNCNSSSETNEISPQAIALSEAHANIVEDDVTFSDGKIDILPLSADTSLLNFERESKLLEVKKIEQPCTDNDESNYICEENDIGKGDEDDSFQGEQDISNGSSGDSLNISQSLNEESVSNKTNIENLSKISSKNSSWSRESPSRLISDELMISTTSSSSVHSATVDSHSVGVCSHAKPVIEIIPEERNKILSTEKTFCNSNSPPVLLTCFQLKLSETDSELNDNIKTHGTLGRRDTLQQVEEIWEANAKILPYDEPISSSSDEMNFSEGKKEETSLLKRVFFGDSNERLFSQNIDKELEIQHLKSCKGNDYYKDTISPIAPGSTKLYFLNLHINDSDEESSNQVREQMLPDNEDDLDNLIRKLRTLLHKEHQKNCYFESLITEMKAAEDNLVEKLENSENISFDFQKATVKLSSGLDQVEFMSKLFKEEARYMSLCYQEATEKLIALRKEKDTLIISITNKDYNFRKLKNEVKIFNAVEYKTSRAVPELFIRNDAKDAEVQTIPLKDFCQIITDIKEQKDESSYTCFDFLQLRSCDVSSQTLMNSYEEISAKYDPQSVVRSTQTDIISLQDQLLQTVDCAIQTEDCLIVDEKNVTEISTQTSNHSNLSSYSQTDDLEYFGLRNIMQIDTKFSQTMEESFDDGYMTISSNNQTPLLSSKLCSDTAAAKDLYSNSVNKCKLILLDKEIQTENDVNFMDDNVHKQFDLLSSSINDWRLEMKTIVSDIILESVDSNKRLILNSEATVSNDHSVQLQAKYIEFKNLAEEKCCMFEQQINGLKNPSTLLLEIQSSRELLNEMSRQMVHFSRLENVVAEKSSETTKLFNDHSESIKNLFTKTVQIPEQMSKNLDESVETLTIVIGSKLDEQQTQLTDDIDCIDKNLMALHCTLKTMTEDSHCNNINVDNLNKKIELILKSSDSSCSTLNNLSVNEKEVKDKLQDVVTAIELSTLESNEAINESLKILVRSLDETVSENFQIVQDFLQNLQSTLVTKVNEIKTDEIERKYLEVDKLSGQIESIHLVLNELRLSYETSNKTFSDAIFQPSVIEAIRGGNDQAFISLRSQSDIVLNLVEGCKEILEKVVLSQNDHGSDSIIEDLRSEVKYYIKEHNATELKLKILECRNKDMDKEFSLKVEELRIKNDKMDNLDDKLSHLMKEQHENQELIRHLQTSKEALTGDQNLVKQVEQIQEKLNNSIPQNPSTDIDMNFPKAQNLQLEINNLKRERDQLKVQNSFLLPEIQNLSELSERQQNEALNETRKLKSTIANNDIRIRNLQKQLLDNEIIANSHEKDVTEDLEQQFFHEIKALKMSKKSVELSLKGNIKIMNELQDTISELEIEKDNLDAQLTKKDCQIIHLKKEYTKQQKLIHSLKLSLEHISNNDDVTHEEYQQRMSDFETEIKSKQNMILNLRERLSSIGQEKHELINELSLNKSDHLCTEIVLQEKKIAVEASNHLKEKLQNIADNISTDYIPKTQLEFLYRDVESYFESMYSLRKKQWDEMAVSKYKIEEQKYAVMREKMTDLNHKVQSRNETIETMQSRMSLSEKNCHLWKTRYDHLFEEFHKISKSATENYPTKDDHNRQVVPSKDVNFQVMKKELDHLLKTPYEESLFVHSAYYSPQSLNNSLSSSYQLDISNSSGIHSPPGNMERTKNNWNNLSYLKRPMASQLSPSYYQSFECNSKKRKEINSSLDHSFEDISPSDQ